MFCKSKTPAGCLYQYGNTQTPTPRKKNIIIIVIVSLALSQIHCYFLWISAICPLPVHDRRHQLRRHQPGSPPLSHKLKLSTDLLAAVPAVSTSPARLPAFCSLRASGQPRLILVGENLLGGWSHVTAFIHCGKMNS